MKLRALASIGHNIADSLASGIGLLVGVYEMDVFGEAAKTPEGFIDVNFLNGRTSGGQPSSSLARAVELYAEALPALCERHGVDPSAFRQLTARFVGEPFFERFVVTVEDQQGRLSTAEYTREGKRAKVLDHLGRVRPK
jgi:hypothetical protein